METFSGSGNLTKIFTSNQGWFGISNLGATDLVFTIGSTAFTVKVGEDFEEFFPSFISVTITATSNWEAYASEATDDYVVVWSGEGTGNYTKDFTSNMQYFSMTNDDDASASFTIYDDTIDIGTNGIYGSQFPPFTSVTITSSGAWRAYAKQYAYISDPYVRDICNIALSNLGTSKPIVTLHEGTTEADECSKRYAPARDTVLRDFPWNFANRHVVLSAVTDVTDTALFEDAGWGYVYEYPDNCVNAILVYNESTNQSETKEKFRVTSVDDAGTEKLRILSNIEGAYLEYTAQIRNVRLYDPQFKDALAFRLAADLAMPLKSSTNDRDKMMQYYNAILAQAKHSNAVEGYKEPISTNRYKNAR